MKPALHVEGLSVSFGLAHVIRDLSFDVEPGSALAVIGPNASGKTVLFRALIGVIPYRGTIAWGDGTRIGYVPQKLDLERDLPVTGHDLLRAKGHVAGIGKEATGEVLDLVHLPAAAAAKPIGTLSGGQFQRLLLAVALLGRPTVLLCDEPTAGVDEPGEEQLYEMIQRVREARGLALLLISHELSVVFRYATHVLCLSRERPCFGPPREVLTPEAIEQLYGAPLRYHHHA
jgi:zinc transport system ATP-binding protein